MRPKPKKKFKSAKRIAAHPRRAGRVAAGRFSTLTTIKSRCICKALKGGAYDEIACEAAGVPKRTFYAWLERGERELDRILALEERNLGAIKPLPSELPFLQFMHSVQEARSAAELSAISSARRAWQKGEWRAAIAFVERRHRSRWRSGVEFAQDPENPITPPAQVRVVIPFNGRCDPQLLGDQLHYETAAEHRARTKAKAR